MRGFGARDGRRELVRRVRRVDVEELAELAHADLRDVPRDVPDHESRVDVDYLGLGVVVSARGVTAMYDLELPQAPGP